jgi:mRNA interferase MazF
VNRGDLYRVRKPGGRDPRKQRVFVVFSRQVLLDSSYSTVICAPVYSTRSGLSTQVEIGPESGLKRDSAIHCDELVSISKNRLTDFVGTLSPARLRELGRALAIALELA